MSKQRNLPEAGGARVVLVALALVLILGCSATLDRPPGHNRQGGWVEACGDLAGEVGDDC